MVRPPPKSDPVAAREALRNAPPPAVLFAATCSVITPLFGGGAVARAPDQARPVRGTSVRGHLRFWWRACFGHRFATAAELYEAEAAIWGKAGAHGTTASVVMVEVDAKQTGALRPAVHWRPSGRDGRLEAHWTVDGGPHRGFKLPAYALFPFQGELANGRQSIKKEPDQYLEDVQFEVRLIARSGQTLPAGRNVEHEVRAAAWAWLRFGGIGSRTRRGCGSLSADSVPFAASPSLPEDPGACIRAIAEEWSAVQAAAPGAPLDAWSHKTPLLLGGSLASQPARADAYTAWTKVIADLQYFRQGLGFARDPGNGLRPGQSRWPEADSFRRLIPGIDGHPVRHPSVADGPYVPKADLGMPLLIQQLAVGNATPTIEAGPKGSSRMASPLILKALPVGQGTKAAPFALCLSTPHAWEGPGVRWTYGGRGGPLREEQVHRPAAPNLVDAGPGSAGPMPGNVRELFMQRFADGAPEVLS